MPASRHAGRPMRREPSPIATALLWVALHLFVALAMAAQTWFEVIVWESLSRTPWARLRRRIGVGRPINAVAWSPGGSRLAVSINGGSEIAVLSSRNWKVESRFTRQSSAYSGIDFLSESNILTPSATWKAENPSSLLVWNENGEQLATIPSPGALASGGGPAVGPAYVFAVDKDHTRIAARDVGGLRGVIIYEAGSGLVQQRIASDLPLQEVGSARSLAFSPDGRQLAIGYSAGHLEIYDPATGRLVRRQRLYPGDLAVGALTYSPDGNHLATGIAKGININRDNPISADIWRTDTGEHLRSLEGFSVACGPYRETTQVSSLSWSPQGDRLAIGDGISVRVWEHVSTSPRQILSMRFGAFGVGAYTVSFSPSGLMAVGAGHSVLIFRV